LFERGFKTWCERYSAEVRSTLGLGPGAPLDPFRLAQHLGIRVWTPHQVPGLSEEKLATLLRNDGVTPSCWSAVTIVFGSRVVVILNSSHSPGRQASDLTHELAHRIRGHQTHDVDVSPDGIMLLSGYDKLQEEEADWLSACLLLPREALISIKKQGLESSIAAERFGVSQRMLNYRLATSGVNRQFS
jgi:hypothetical protein